MWISYQQFFFVNERYKYTILTAWNDDKQEFYVENEGEKEKKKELDLSKKWIIFESSFNSYYWSNNAKQTKAQKF